MGYTVILEQEPDGGYVMHAPALPGCVSQGDTRKEALANIREAMELYIEDCVEAGDALPKELRPLCPSNPRPEDGVVVKFDPRTDGRDGRTT